MEEEARNGGTEVEEEAQVSHFLIEKSEPGSPRSPRPLYPHMQIPVIMPDPHDIGVARGREFSTEFWVAYATKMMWIQTKIVCPIAAYMIVFKVSALPPCD